MARLVKVREASESSIASRSCSLCARSRTNSCCSVAATSKIGSTLIWIGLISEALALSLIHI